MKKIAAYGSGLHAHPVLNGGTINTNWQLSGGVSYPETMVYHIVLNRTYQHARFFQLAPSGCGGSMVETYYNRYSTALNFSSAVDNTNSIGLTISSLGNESSVSAVYSSSLNISLAIDASKVMKSTVLTGNWVTTLASHGLNYRSLCTGNGCFVLAGRVAADNSGYIATSTDGITWTRRLNVPNTIIYSITSGNGQIIASAGSLLYVSSDNGITWTAVARPDRSTVKTLEFINGIFIETYSIAGKDGIRSCNSYSHFNGVDSTIYTLNRICYNFGIFNGRVAYADGIYICGKYLSRNLINWYYDSNPYSALKIQAFGNINPATGFINKYGFVAIEATGNYGILHTYPSNFTPQIL